MKSAISVQRVSKRFKLGTRSYRTLRDSVMTGVRAAWQSVARVLRRTPVQAEDDLWAVKDISFEVKPGEVVGIVGRNGAGKSTLLKLLSRITSPTEGEIQLRGRV